MVGPRSGSGDGQEIMHTHVTLLARGRNEDEDYAAKRT